MSSQAIPLQRTFTALNQALGGVASFAKDTFSKDKGEGSLANSLAPKLEDGWSSGTINVVKDYDWTPSPRKNRDDIPYVRLIEYKCNETSIKKQLDLYSKLTPQTFFNAIGKGGETREVLDVYQEIFAKDEPTDFSYWFPYFNKTGFELGTPEWQQLDPIGESLKQLGGGVSGLLGMFGSTGKALAGTVENMTKTGEFAAAAAQTSLAWQYPSVGVFDRPRIFAGHSGRQITISFPLYTTLNDWAWAKNRDLIYLLMSQNLFNKRDYITGVPPVFYDVFIPGQYYCYAAAMTNINVENLGNVRMMDGESYIIPDAYQVTLTLSEMTMPSKNQFEAVVNGAAKKFVSTSTISSDRTERTRSVTEETAARTAQQ